MCILEFSIHVHFLNILIHFEIFIEIIYYTLEIFINFFLIIIYGRYKNVCLVKQFKIVMQHFS